MCQATKDIAFLGSRECFLPHTHFFLSYSFSHFFLSYSFFPFLSFILFLTLSGPQSHIWKAWPTKIAFSVMPSMNYICPSVTQQWWVLLFLLWSRGHIMFLTELCSHSYLSHSLIVILKDKEPMGDPCFIFSGKRASSFPIYPQVRYFAINVPFSRLYILIWIFKVLWGSELIQILN